MVSQYHILAGFILDGIVILLHVQKCPLMLGRCCMDGFMLDHFQQLVYILCHGMPAVYVGMEPLQTKAY